MQRVKVREGKGVQQMTLVSSRWSPTFSHSSVSHYQLGRHALVLVLSYLSECVVGGFTQASDWCLPTSHKDGLGGCADLLPRSMRLSAAFPYLKSWEENSCTIHNTDIDDV